MTDLLKRLSVETGLPESTVKSIISNAPERYKEYLIHKKNGGYRKIAQPARELKLIQRAFIDIVLSKLPIHSAASAYRRGKNIRDNAMPHSHSGPILKMDFKDFFPSITERDWSAYCQQTGCLTDPGDIRLSSLLLFHKPSGGRILRLAIGAPSSPILSNVIMFQFDEAISNAIAKHQVIYTRYADDLTFSAPRTGHLNSVAKAVKNALKEIPYPQLKINHEKTTHVTMKYHRQVTGLTLANDGRVTIGRDHKRSLRAQLHYFINGKLDEAETAHLAGKIAFVKSVEPEFYFSLLEKLGAEKINFLLSKSNRKKLSLKKSPKLN
ncbi:retron St85 family RNA-directed DNA polymerase [Agrobacterium salinitolerans]|nr:MULTISPECIES: retron St85 family RNA-directed DNA polymerase [Agrobacterium]MCZ7891035.1 retron St85 family RNA-directed DNA polymerase [Agrobacterium salinitolerans]